MNVTIRPSDIYPTGQDAVRVALQKAGMEVLGFGVVKIGDTILDPTSLTPRSITWDCGYAFVRYQLRPLPIPSSEPWGWE